MDSLPKFGTSIAECVGPTFGTYTPLLEANATAIRSTPVEEFSYGPNPRQKLDVYASTTKTSANSPILVFVHGGGFHAGGKRLPVANGLAHHNLGHFFADQFGFQVVIIDYRLMSHGARFPSGGEDVRLTVEWIIQKLALPGKRRQLFLMGASAGGVHVSTFLLSPLFRDTRRKIVDDAAHSGIELTGVVELSVPLDFEQAEGNRDDVLPVYYGSKEGMKEDCPLGLLKRAQPNETELKKVPFLVVSEELDPEDEILGPIQRFMEAWSGTKPEKLYVAGHNHISPPLSVGTGIEKEEKWANDVGAWMQRRF